MLNLFFCLPLYQKFGTGSFVCHYINLSCWQYYCMFIFYVILVILWVNKLMCQFIFSNLVLVLYFSTCIFLIFYTFLKNNSETFYQNSKSAETFGFRGQTETGSEMKFSTTVSNILHWKRKNGEVSDWRKDNFIYHSCRRSRCLTLNSGGIRYCWCGEEDSRYCFFEFLILVFRGFGILGHEIDIFTSLCFCWIFCGSVGFQSRAPLILYCT